jgi:hypothetical protein
LKPRRLRFTCSIPNLSSEPWSQILCTRFSAWRAGRRLAWGDLVPTSPGAPVDLPQDAASLLWAGEEQRSHRSRLIPSWSWANRRGRTGHMDVDPANGLPTTYTAARIVFAETGSGRKAMTARGESEGRRGRASVAIWCCCVRWSRAWERSSFMPCPRRWTSNRRVRL